VLILGHRGARGEAPENTQAAFAAAVASGADGVELDLRLDADQRLLVIHDATVDRTTDGSGRVRELSAAALSRLDAGRGQTIPTLAEVLAAHPTLGELQLEVKALPEADHLAMMHGLETVFDDAHWRSRVRVTSFDRDFLASLGRRCPSWPRGLVSEDTGPDSLDAAEALGVGALVLRQDLWTTELARRCRGAGLHASAWTVNEFDDLRRLANLPIDSVVTDYPSRCRVWLRELDATS
jgi:glycerophosphoryl diester phosphodiesterase